MKMQMSVISKEEFVVQAKYINSKSSKIPVITVIVLAIVHATNTGGLEFADTSFLTKVLTGIQYRLKL